MDRVDRSSLTSFFFMLSTAFVRAARERPEVYGSATMPCPVCVCRSYRFAFNHLYSWDTPTNQCVSQSSPKHTVAVAEIVTDFRQFSPLHSQEEYYYHKHYTRYTTMSISTCTSQESSHTTPVYRTTINNTRYPGIYFF